MYNLDDIVKIYFGNTTAREVLKGEVRFDDYPEEAFLRQALMSMKYYSDTENKGIYDYAKGYLHRNRYDNFVEKRANVFEALVILANRLLLMQDGEVACKYSEFVRWRNVTTSIGETSLICAFLANRNAKRSGNQVSFLWNTSIGHNNTQLNRLLKQGVAENHFHLFGSAPIFEMAWLNLMNHVQDPKVLNALRGIDQNRRSSHSYNCLSMVKDSLEKQHLQAAFIRAVLMIFLIQKNYGIDAGNILKSYHYTNARIDKILAADEDELLKHEKSRIQNMINDLKNIAESVKRNSSFDYALYLPEIFDEKNVNAVFSGERSLIYYILLGYYEGDRLYPQMYKWLYAYLLIKVDMRSEILQVNDNIGFHNFSIYTGRKGGFLYSNMHDRLMVKEAVKGSLQTGNIKSLEVRVRPGSNAKENARWITEYDKIIMGDDELAGADRNYFYYVFHFIKS